MPIFLEVIQKLYLNNNKIFDNNIIIVVFINPLTGKLIQSSFLQLYEGLFSRIYMLDKGVGSTTDLWSVVYNPLVRVLTKGLTLVINC